MTSNRILVFIGREFHENLAELSIPNCGLLIRSRQLAHLSGRPSISLSSRWLDSVKRQAGVRRGERPTNRLASLWRGRGSFDARSKDFRPGSVVQDCSFQLARSPFESALPARSPVRVELRLPSVAEPSPPRNPLAAAPSLISVPRLGDVPLETR